MLDVEIKHDIDKNYLVVQGEQEPDYMVQMLAGNHVGGFLDLEVRVLNNRQQYYYDITGKENLLQKSGRSKWTQQELVRTISGILDAIGKAREYLLSPEHFVLEPEYIYRDIEKGDIFLCYVWSENRNMNQQLTELFAYFMNVVDYQDQLAVDFIYKIYDVSREEQCTLTRLWSVFSQGVSVEEQPMQTEPQAVKEEPVLAEPVRASKGLLRKQEKIGVIEKKQKQQQQEKSIGEVKDRQKNSMQKVATQKTDRSLSFVERMVMAIVLQVLFVVLFAVLAYNGIFVKEGSLDYTKVGAVLLICGAIDFYVLTKLFAGLENGQKEKTAASPKKKQKITQSVLPMPTGNQVNQAVPPMPKGNQVNQAMPLMSNGNVVSQAVSPMPGENVMSQAMPPNRDMPNQAVLSMSNGDMSDQGLQAKANGNVQHVSVPNQSVSPVQNLSVSPIQNLNQSAYTEEEIKRVNLKKEAYTQASLPNVNLMKDLTVSAATMEEDLNRTIVTPSVSLAEQNQQQVFCYLIPQNQEQTMISVKEFPFFIGRFQKDTDGLREKLNISRMHCKLEQVGQKVFVRDLASTNGTYVNQKMLGREERREIKEGDVISLADVSYQFSWQPHM